MSWRVRDHDAISELEVKIFNAIRDEEVLKESLKSPGAVILSIRYIYNLYRSFRGKNEVDKIHEMQSSIQQNIDENKSNLPVKSKFMSHQLRLNRMLADYNVNKNVNKTVTFIRYIENILSNAISDYKEIEKPYLEKNDEIIRLKDELRTKYKVEY